MREEKRIFTLGTSDRTIEKMVHLLRSNRIVRVLDVRSRSASKFPQFNREALAPFLREAGMEYFHLGKELGGFRQEGYEAYSQTDSSRLGLDRLEELAGGAPAAILCAERSPARCHRRFIARSLRERGWQVIHIGTEPTAPTGEPPPALWRS